MRKPEGYKNLNTWSLWESWGSLLKYRTNVNFKANAKTFPPRVSQRPSLTKAAQEETKATNIFH